MRFKMANKEEAKGQCYDQNYRRFLQIWAIKFALFLKPMVSQTIGARPPI
jgi:hypothetical protein